MRLCLRWHLLFFCIVRIGSGFLVSHGSSQEVLDVSNSTAFHRDPVNVLAVRQPAAEEPVPPPTQHVVEHIELLNNQNFWWLMGSLVVCVGVAVVTLEAAPISTPSKGNSEEEASSSGNRRIAHLCTCVVTLWIAMILWGVAQEYVMTASFPTVMGEQESFPSAFFLVLCNRSLTAIITSCMLLARGGSFIFPGFLETLAPAMSNMGSSWFQYASLSFISFTLQTTVKSAKLLPVLLVGTLRGKAYSMKDYGEAVVIAVAIGVFGRETEKHSTSVSSTWFGVLMLLGYVACDSATPHLQDAIFDRHKAMDALQATCAGAMLSACVLFLGLFFTGGFHESIHFLIVHPSMILPLIVLACSSCLTQVLANHTIKHFGPVVFTLVQCTRQLMSVLLSSMLFVHTISATAWIAVVVAFGVVLARSLRLAPPATFIAAIPVLGGPQGESATPTEAVEQGVGGSTKRDEEALLQEHASHPASGPPVAQREISPASGPGGLVEQMMASFQNYNTLIICAVGIHANYCFYAVAQEFLTTHTFGGQLFTYPLFLVAVDHSLATCLAIAVVVAHGGILAPSGWAWTSWPALTDLAATWMQHQALYFMFFPAHTLMKTLKVVPVMLVGSCLKNRSYSRTDYIEGLLLSVLVAYFVYDFQLMSTLDMDSSSGVGGSAVVGVMLMLGYVVVDSFTSNLEDYVFLRTKLDASHMLLGIEAISSVVAWLMLWANGELLQIAAFVAAHPQVMLYVLLLGMSAACGAYTCTVCVRLLGPAIFTLLMMSRQVCSLLISVLVYQHGVSALHCFCMVS
eukprot:CAMPEP_0178389266 /NCGR_PEP_ID=MMETSP0689_2-20121128/10026_1 /TAXON_ID=160604 /ORGANISM="Amphidinium massartii, Strain CS-259" /LENGTH=797 /DNA_ID=CAMNT_0020009707 /DNA_START=188 /DNA_END=2578 /DNA_ORIENTATION=-